MSVLALYRVAYVLLGAFLAAVAGYLFAKYFALLFGVWLHVTFPRHYSLEHVVRVWVDTGVWIRPLVAVVCGAWAALRCYRFCCVPAHTNRRRR
jgi:hypothetical protein